MRIVGGSIGGKYEIRRVLGIGGMGAVYEAMHRYTNRRVAVKLLGPDYASSPEAVERFLQEAQAPSSIGHPNIVEVLDAGEDAQHGLYVVLEYLEGEDLESAVERGNIDLPTLLDVTAQMLDALEAAHGKGFVHRDIKPANIFITKNRDGSVKAKLLDFGIAKNIARGLTVGFAVMGTPHYMSPEQAQGHPVDPRADLWAVGAVLFHAIAGVPPYDGDNPNVIMVNIIMGEPPSLRALRPDLSKPLLDLVEGALKKSLDARWRSARQMADKLATAPELHGAVLKISSTMRNRGGVVSEMRPSGVPPVSGPSTVNVALSGAFGAPSSEPAPRVSTGTLGPEDAMHAMSLAPTAYGESVVPSAPPPRVAPIAAATPRPETRPARGIGPMKVVLVAVVASLVAAGVVFATRPREVPRPVETARPVSAPRSLAAQPDAALVAAPDAPPAQPGQPAPPAPSVQPTHPAVALVVDAGSPGHEDGAGRRHARGHSRHGGHEATTATTAQPVAQTPPVTPPTQPRPPTQRIGGLNIGNYNSP